MQHSTAQTVPTVGPRLNTSSA